MAHAAHGTHFSNLRSHKITMLMKYDKNCIDSSTFVNCVKVHRNFIMCVHLTCFCSQMLSVMMISNKYRYLVFLLSIYIKESRVSYTIYKSRTAEPIWLKIGGEVA